MRYCLTDVLWQEIGRLMPHGGKRRRKDDLRVVLFLLCKVVQCLMLRIVALVLAKVLRDCDFMHIVMELLSVQ